MKMSEELETAFVQQITREYETAFLCRQLAAELELRDLPGMATWFRRHAESELGHADRLIKHLTDRRNHPVIGLISLPSIKLETVAEAFQIALDAEREVSEALRALCRLADAQHDYDSRPVIDWFITEQIGEEAALSEILGRLALVDEDGAGLLFLDAELGGGDAPDQE